MTAVSIATIGSPRLTMGFDRFDRIDLDRHRALHGALAVPTLEELLKITEAVDIRGRGGAAFPFARKLMAVAKQVGRPGDVDDFLLPGEEDDHRGRRQKRAVVVVNGSEGEPGSKKDKVLLTRNPHLVLDGAQIAATALGTRDIVIAIEDETAARSMRAAIVERRMPAEVVRLPERFISGESGAVIRAINGETPIPPGRKVRAAESGVDGRPTLLSNTETFAQLAVLVSLGPDLYASVGTDSEPGTTLLTVGGTTVVECPLGTPLASVFAQCGVQPGQGVLVGGYHGEWITPEAARTAIVSRAGFQAVGGSLGAGIILPLPEGTCPLREVARIASYMAGQSAGQCGPCRLGLPDLYRSLEALVDGSGSPELVRRAAGIGRGRGACSHPDGTARFALSALNTFARDIEIHQLNGTCGQPCFGVLPLPVPGGGESKFAIDWSRCEGHGLCAYLVPELIQLDRYGFPVVLDAEIPGWMETDAQRAVAMCPALALRMVPVMAKQPKAKRK
ncbi:NADH-quinone oxidoreductase subunit NuoF family protein [Thermomonospora curvata]|uniref:NADH dehydrogenase (Quinone) n=1 Tax=Thermomonospora curvata (strain ATCC 19995 / DSM 43183 / JCM 3096 / KCTC 9072 / NBRC 15933 / NCIMB 10081 / Henssen B9) TaxID=471852 RepID=D1A5I5_THECD|nr:NADH-quinone oxidoreductase subunit NuoF family protein [Thermomonospora curvata]ACY96345.1 NADH dehydrogenase (quinone) [Thermomonospora curvata DSM 43183]